MTLIRRKRNTLLVAASCLLLIALPAVASAQGRGRGWARGHDKSWKCGKFVNCHDARNGRWDGRGPRSSRFFNANGILVNNRGRHRRFRNSDNDRFDERRLRIRNQNFDNDDLFRRGDRGFRNDNFLRMSGRGRHGRG